MAIMAGFWLSVNDSMRWLLEKLLRWDVVGIGSTLIYTTGVAAMYGNDYVIAYVCYFVGIAWLSAKAISWEETRQHKNRLGISGFVLVAAIGLFAISLLWVGHQHRGHDAELAKNEKPALTATEPQSAVERPKEHQEQIDHEESPAVKPIPSKHAHKPTAAVTKQLPPVNGQEGSPQNQPAGYITFLGQVINGWAPMMQVNQTETPLDDVHLSVTQSFPPNNSDSEPSPVGWQKEIEIGTCRARLSMGLAERFPVGGQQRMKFDIFMMTRFQTYREIIKILKENDSQYKAELRFYDGGAKPSYEQTMTLGIAKIP